ncbi:MAG: MBL fold metallo-hydrolase [Peptococcaceae bacterium]|nr:MBL fold metallo-hydrolase [Peptococcaceae bacterium]
MELAVLGCWAPYPRAGGACSGYLLRAGGMNVLLEAGNGTLSRLMGFIDFRRLDAVVVSHLHHDHYLDLFPLRHAVEGARRDGSRSGPLKLFAPAGPPERFNLLAGYGKAFDAVPIESLPVEKMAGVLSARRLDLGCLSFHFVPARHSLPGYSVAVTGAGRLVFSGDTARTDELAALAEGADLFLCEASGLDSDACYLRDSHLTARQAGEVARAAGARRLLITHFWPEYEPAMLAALAEEGFGAPVTAAREGETYRV